MSFYNLKNLPDLELFLSVSLNKSFRVITEKIDHRQNLPGLKKQEDKTIEEILTMSLGENFAFATMIWKKKMFGDLSDYWEVCATATEDDVEYFVWMSLSEKEGAKLIKDYNLQENEQC